MPICCTCEERSLHAAISGEIDHHGAKSVMQELDVQIAQHMPRELLLDCGGITFMDSSGIAVLLRAWQKIHGLGGTMSVRNMPTQAGKVLKAAGLDRLISLNP